MTEELTPAERAAEQVLTNALPHMVGLVNDALARMIVAAVRPAVDAEPDSWKELARSLYRTEPCDLDHNGNCQEHLWFPFDRTQPCPDGIAQQRFAKEEEDER